MKRSGDGMDISSSVYSSHSVALAGSIDHNNAMGGDISTLIAKQKVCLFTSFNTVKQNLGF